MIFEEKYFSYCIILTDQISLSDCLYFMKYWAICVLQLFVNQAVTYNFELNLIFLIKPIFQHDQKVKTKISIRA